ncbi:MAG: hypothetical protein ABI600_21415 [Luteolibacter sp.]
MKKIITWLSVLPGMLCAGPEAAQTGWQWEAPFVVGQPGMVRVELPPEVLDISRSDLGDVRVVSTEKSEAPYFVEKPSRREGAVREASGFRVNQSGTNTVIEVLFATKDRIETLDLVSPAQEFLKSVTIEGNKSGAWQALATNEVIFRQSGGSERLRVPIPADVWEGFRFTMDDGRSQPVPFTGVRAITSGEKPETVELTVSLGQREEGPNETRLALDLGAGNLNVAELRFEIPDAVFSRKCTLGYSVPTSDGESHVETFATGTIYRVAGESGVSTDELVIPVERRISARFIVATFRNGDSPPLMVRGAKVRCYPTILAFHAAEAGEWTLRSGNRDAKAANYDLNALRGELTAARGPLVKLGPLRKNPNYVVPEVLTGVKVAGAEIDLKDWSRRRKVDCAPSGVVRIDLDAKTLAGSQTDLGDIRLVQNGKQIPYLVGPGTVFHELKPSGIFPKNDPKRPKISRWEIELPVGGVPMVDLTARSSAPLFTRRFVVAIEGKDDLGNAWREQVGTADWTKSGSGEVPLVLNLNGERLPATFILETDDGDNPPIPLDEVSLRFASPSIIAKLSDPAPLFLCYGNPKAAPPQYDLRVVRSEMLAAVPQATTLGDEEILRPDTRDHRAPDAGSPWLWVALAAVVAVLLAIVAKLLPAQAPGGES